MAAKGTLVFGKPARWSPMPSASSWTRSCARRVRADDRGRGCCSTRHRHVPRPSAHAAAAGYREIDRKVSSDEAHEVRGVPGPIRQLPVRAERRRHPAHAVPHDGRSLVWDWKAHDEMADAFANVAGDRDIKVLIHGHGRELQRRLGSAGWPRHRSRSTGPSATRRGCTRSTRRRGTGGCSSSTLAVEVPVISVVNGPCNIRSRGPLLGDVVLASEGAYFRTSHFPRGWSRVTASTSSGTSSSATTRPLLPVDRHEADGTAGPRVGCGRGGAAQGQGGARWDLARTRETAALDASVLRVCCSRRS